MKDFISEHPVLIAIILIVVLWDLVLRIVGMWHAARRGEVKWFIALSIFSSIGILPIVYLRRR